MTCLSTCGLAGSTRLPLWHPCLTLPHGWLNMQARVLEAMLLLLDHSNQELLYSICGTLINFTVERWEYYVMYCRCCFT